MATSPPYNDKKTYPSLTPQVTGNTPPNPPAPNAASPGAPPTAGPAGTANGPGGSALAALRTAMQHSMSPGTPTGGDWQPKGPATPTGSGGPSTPAPLYGSDLESKINSWLSGTMEGKNQPFTPELMGSMKGSLFNAANGQADTAIKQANQNAIGRGMFRSGLPTDAIMQARANAGQNFTKGSADLDSQAAQANAGQRMSAVQALQQSLNGGRDFYLKDFMAKKPTPGPDYNSQLINMMGNMDEPNFG